MGTLKFTILTLFPDVIESYVNSSILQKAREKGLLEVSIINIRQEPWQQVDDYVYGGGSGMAIKVDVVVDVLRKNNLINEFIVFLTPSGETLKQSISRELATSKEHIVLLCGHYEGIDARIEKYIKKEISIGDYIVTSGELASLVLLDSVVRLVPGVINEQSLKDESFDNFLLDFPVYTRPKDFEGSLVPDVYLNGNHREIEAYRFRERERITIEKRPDLYKLYIKNRKG